MNGDRIGSTQANADPGEWIGLFPALARLEPESRLRLSRAARPVAAPSGTTLFHPGDACERYLMVIGGSIRVWMVAENGREVVLYRVGAGETCILTTACLMASEAYGAEAVAETDVRAVTLSAAAFDELATSSAVFRRFVFASYGTRLADLMLLIQEVAFRRVDVRLARFLIDHRGDEGQIATTHQNLAVELGTAREVVSRQLKEFERRGVVTLSRGGLRVIDVEGLRRIAEQGDL